jgi:hypothetical protein
MFSRKRGKKSVSKRPRYEEDPHIVMFKQLGETKTTIFFCYIFHRGVMFQMMYYEQEGRVKKDIMTNLEDEDKEMFVHYFISVLQRKNIPDDMIEQLVEEIM